MLIPVHRIAKRSGFTLVELMVAAALSIGIMYILSWAFQQGLDSLSLARALGDLQERERAVAVVMRDDLARDHFDDDGSNPFYGPKLRDQRVDRAGLSPSDWQPPPEGFFRIYQGSTIQNDPTMANTTMPYRFAVDSEGIPVYVATDHALHFTVKLPGTRPHELFSARSLFTEPTTVNLSSPLVFANSSPAFALNPSVQTEWAEIAYFLAPQAVPRNLTTSTTGQPQSLYTLRRRQRILFPLSITRATIDSIDPTDSPKLDTLTAQSELSYWDPDGMPTTPNAEPNTQETVTSPLRRMGLGIDPNYIPFALADGSDVVLEDVLSFQVQVAYNGNLNPVFQDLPLSTGNTLLAGRHVFDTWTMRDDSALGGPGADFSNWFSPTMMPTPTTLPLSIHVTALKITIRVWDRNTQTTRQITFMQEV